MASDVTDSETLIKLWAWFETHKKQTLWGAIIVAGAVFVGWFIVNQQEQSRIASGEALSKVAIPQILTPNARPAPDAYLRVAAKYPDSSAGARALLLAAAGLFDEGKYAEAQAQFERFRREHHDNTLLASALLGIAACLDAQGKTADAINAYRDLVDHHPNESVVLPQAEFALGRLYEAQNHPAEARTFFEKVLASDQYGSIGSEAGIRLEELNRKYRNLAPSTPLPTNGPTFNIQKQ
jgi:predicted negative regulator of RcsB-dependent stress response